MFSVWEAPVQFFIEANDIDGDKVYKLAATAKTEEGETYIASPIVFSYTPIEDLRSPEDLFRNDRILGLFNRGELEGLREGLNKVLGPSPTASMSGGKLTIRPEEGGGEPFTLVLESMLYAFLDLHNLREDWEIFSPLLGELIDAEGTEEEADLTSGGGYYGGPGPGRIPVQLMIKRGLL